MRHGIGDAIEKEGEVRCLGHADKLVHARGKRQLWMNGSYFNLGMVKLER